MVLSISVIAGIVAMVSWGIADFMQSYSVRNIGTYKLLYLGNILWTAFFIPFVFFVELNIEFSNLIILCVASALQVFALSSFFESMKIGDVSVVAPISGSYSLITISLLIFFLGKTITQTIGFVIFLLIIGIVLTSTDLKKIKKIHTTKGIKEALIALVLWGIYFFVLEIVTKDTTLIFYFPETKGITVFFYSGITMGISTIIYSLYKKGYMKFSDLKNTKKIKKKTLFFIFSAQFIYLIAWLVVNYAISIGETSIITAISSLFPAITVVLAQIVYKEKLVLNQKLGLLIILVGLFFIGYLS